VGGRCRAWPAAWHRPNLLWGRDL